MRERIRLEETRGKVFADIGLPNARDRLPKADLAIRISEATRPRGLTQTQALAY